MLSGSCAHRFNWMDCVQQSNEESMNIFTIRARSVGRRLGIHHLVYGIREKLNPNRKYEDRCFRALQETIAPGDVVWDVGANVGVYSEKFCEWVGSNGRVIAFEPNPQAAEMLINRLGGCDCLSVERIALGLQGGQGTLAVGSEITSGHLRHNSETSSGTELVVPVEIASGDQVCERLGAKPNVLKIDVEGSEEDVLMGSLRILESSTLRAVMIEVHFQALESRGQPNAPIRMEKLLRKMQFRLKWVDANHLLASR
jgi:FkbM family methyltransferase